MTTYIIRPDGTHGTQSHNLRGLLDYARVGAGVSRIDIFDTGAETARPGALVRVLYRNGAFAESYFSRLSHAEEWANDRRKASPRVSWFAGCHVETHRLKPFRRFNWTRGPGSPLEGYQK